MSTLTENQFRTSFQFILQNGDQLNLAEFLSRWEECPEIKKAELINGVVYMNAAAVSVKFHSDQHGFLATLLGYYSIKTIFTKLGLEASIFLDDENCFQPDLHLRINTPKYRQTIEEGKYLKNAPELVAEIAYSSVNKDHHLKKAAYEKFGVKEYIIWSTMDNKFSYYELINGTFELKQPENQIFKSSVFPGLWFAEEPLLNQNTNQCLSIMEAGLNSTQHQSFVEKLSS